jgi:GNAT superfamily N-acetyltransferase
MTIYQLFDGPQAMELTEVLRGLYAEVYAEPPYCEGEEHVNQFVERFAEEVRRPGFSLAAALHGQSLIGAAHGWTMGPGKWFSSPTNEPPVDVRNVPKFAIMEWMVRKPYRGSGIGRHLLDLLLAKRPEPFAILASNPAAPARQIYEKWGWRRCGGYKPKLMPPMDILALPLSTRGNIA